ncbi:uncharacterized protein L969DRAFT_93588 [Mixia osmundae IAM 14324]|uniref:Histone acetyltransferase type B catalytic subunit n=1 Tax=Mixia osmundae (strain CBS 9802 / IAM 14324 / JCM 22182 / KY 12970) TaxID=764103 RepID=G7DUE6_MIXOS|nr:uncharacterized protein L969DRAFT_93588 [Mixia osmundae IAM 14324]KEI41078.1 hypothetical protein L969DRAFT_93588 [Mixia osmundae IAM 14324]GAA94206.1 hypothetical protein E5Q_00854 [Mixia osmundae IAM 14324]
MSRVEGVKCLSPVEEMDDSWANDGCQALQLRLVRSDEELQSLDPSEKALVSDFAPDLVHQIYGDEQIIYGYKNLNIELQFASGSLRQYLGISHTDVMPSTSTVKPDPIEPPLYDWLPADYMKDPDGFLKQVKVDSETFKPVGTRIGSYARRLVKNTSKGKEKAKTNGATRKLYEVCEESDEDAIVYEAYSTQMATPGWKEYLRRMQIFTVLFIDAASYCEEDDTHWEFVTLYEKRAVKRKEQSEPQHSFHFVGYTSLYNWFCYPDKTRLRLSQFVILPPYQHAGHGSALYSMVYFWMRGRKDAAEMVVEDPCESFQTLRDKADLHALLSQQLFNDINAPVDRHWIEEKRKDCKLGDRQFARLVEMGLYLKLGKKDPKKLKDYRLFVKERLYRFNYELLSSLSVDERRATLQQTYEGVLEEYEETLAPFLV